MEKNNISSSYMYVLWQALHILFLYYTLELSVIICKCLFVVNQRQQEYQSPSVYLCSIMHVFHFNTTQGYSWVHKFSDIPHTFQYKTLNHSKRAHFFWTLSAPLPSWTETAWKYTLVSLNLHLSVPGTINFIQKSNHTEMITHYIAQYQ